MDSVIKVLALTRATPADIIRLALPISLTAFAEKHGYSKQEVSQCLSGYRRHQKVRESLATELGVGTESIDSVLGSASSAEAAA